VTNALLDLGAQGEGDGSLALMSQYQEKSIQVKN